MTSRRLKAWEFAAHLLLLKKWQLVTDIFSVQKLILPEPSIDILEEALRDAALRPAMLLARPLSGVLVGTAGAAGVRASTSDSKAPGICIDSNWRPVLSNCMGSDTWRLLLERVLVLE